MKRESDNLQGSSPEGISATPALNSVTRQAHLEPWRTEPEIGLERQEQLARCLVTTPDITRGIYPFKGMKLSRADVEWLLATHANGDGPRVGSDEQQHHQGLDLRGADLRDADLHALPLARLHGSLTRTEWEEATTQQRAAASVLLTGADLSEAHLEEAELIGAHLEKAALHEAHLEKADLARAHLGRAFLARAHLKEADPAYQWGALREGRPERGASGESLSERGASTAGGPQRSAPGRRLSQRGLSAGGRPERGPPGGGLPGRGPPGGRLSIQGSPGAHVPLQGPPGGGQT